ncbi:uncharacterized protein LJ206_007824 [Theristicus caerulescens]
MTGEEAGELEGDLSAVWMGPRSSVAKSGWPGPLPVVACHLLANPTGWMEPRRELKKESRCGLVDWIRLSFVAGQSGVVPDPGCEQWHLCGTEILSHLPAAAVSYSPHMQERLKAGLHFTEGCHAASLAHQCTHASWMEIKYHHLLAAERIMAENFRREEEYSGERCWDIFLRVQEHVSPEILTLSLSTP